MKGKCKLSVNVNKVALLRNQRLGNLPDPIKFAVECEKYGVHGITVHPRPDERHIRYSDVPKIKKIIKTEFNIEGYPSERFLRLVEDSCPDQCTLVPDRPDVLTSDSGWDIKTHHKMLNDIVQRLKGQGIRVSLFLDPDPTQIEWAKKVDVDRVELYTGDYASMYNLNRDKAIEAHIETATLAKEYGIGINAGHDLNLDNLGFYNSKIDNLLEVSIGHALISDTLYMGLEKTIIAYLDCLNMQN